MLCGHLPVNEFKLLISIVSASKSSQVGMGNTTGCLASGVPKITVRCPFLLSPTISKD